MRKQQEVPLYLAAVAELTPSYLDFGVPFHPYAIRTDTALLQSAEDSNPPTGGTTPPLSESPISTKPQTPRVQATCSPYYDETATFPGDILFLPFVLFLPFCTLCSAKHPMLRTAACTLPATVQTPACKQAFPCRVWSTPTHVCAWELPTTSAALYRPLVAWGARHTLGA